MYSSYTELGKLQIVLETEFELISAVIHLL